MNREQFIWQIENTFTKALDIVKKKNADYAQDSDPFANFNNAAIAHVSVEQAILVRVTDKISRIGNLLVRDAAVTDESMEDTIVDTINYLAIMLAYRHSKK